MAVCLLAIGLPGAFAQITGPEQDCINAIPVCQEVYVQNNFYSGEGSTKDFIRANSCLVNGEVNSVWYIFTVVVPGTLEFLIIPHSPQDYDFALYNITNLSCANLLTDSMPPLRCNYSSVRLDSTGLKAGYLTTSESSSGPTFVAPVTVSAGETFVLIVDKFNSDPVGYTLDFRPGSAAIADTVPPTVRSVDTMDCANTSVFSIAFSEPIKCSSLAADGSDFQITGPSSPTIISVSSPDCIAGANFTQNATLTLSAPILTGGQYGLIIKQGTDGNSVVDKCDNSAALDTVQFLVPNLVNANFDDQHETSCLADTVQFTSTSTGAVTSWLWDFGDSTPTSTQTNPQHIYTAQGTYTVTLVVSSAECSDTFSRNVTANVDYAAAIGSNPAEPCVGQPFVLSDTAQLAATECFWTVTTSDGSQAGLSLDCTPTFNFSAAGVYTATLIIRNVPLGCADTATTDITLHALPVAGFQADRDPACVNVPINFTDISAGSPASWSWRFTTNDSSGVQNPTFTFTTTGTFPVSLEVVDSFCGTSPTTVDIDVLPSPIFSLGPDDTLCRSEEIILRAYPGADSYLWVTGETTAQITYDSVPSIVWATATLNGCTYTDSLDISERTIDCSYATVPTAFSPNADTRNDVLNVLTKRVSSYELIIFNRWGQEVYRGTNSDQGWDGTFKDEPQDIGVFAYVLNWKNLNGTPFVETGNITLVR